MCRPALSGAMEGVPWRVLLSSHALSLGAYRRGGSWRSMPALNAAIGGHASSRATTRYRETCEGLRSTRDVQAIVTVRASRPGPLHPLDGRLPVTGHYRGRGQHGGAPLDAAFCASDCGRPTGRLTEL